MIHSLLFACWDIFQVFYRLLISLKFTILTTSFKNTMSDLNRVDPDRARRFVGPDLGPNCLQRLSADDTGR